MIHIPREWSHPCSACGNLGITFHHVEYERGDFAHEPIRCPKLDEPGHPKPLLRFDG